MSASTSRGKQSFSKCGRTTRVRASLHAIADKRRSACSCTSTSLSAIHSGTVRPARAANSARWGVRIHGISARLSAKSPQRSSSPARRRRASASSTRPRTDLRGLLSVRALISIWPEESAGSQGSSLCTYSRIFLRRALAAASVPMAGPAAAMSAHSSDFCSLAAASSGLSSSVNVSRSASGIVCWIITRFASWVKTFTIPAPADIQARAARSAAPHMFRRPATRRIFPKEPLLPPCSRSGSRSEAFTSSKVNIEGAFSNARHVIPISARWQAPA